MQNLPEGIEISGFADEISPDFDTQLEVVTRLGMRWISLRAANGKNVADYTPAEARDLLAPPLRAKGVGVSSLGSPIGKVALDDAEGFARQLAQLEDLCGVAEELGCRYIRMFSFYIPAGRDPDSCREEVLEKLGRFLAVAERHGVVLLHENEKEIYGDVARRVRTLFDAIDSPCFKGAFDFANYVQCGEDPADCWDLLRGTVAYIHIKDARFGSGENVVCGTGDGRIAELLRRAIREEGYRGFLTLEPHLVLFDTLRDLETKDAAEVIAVNKARDGADGYRMQYEALCGILGAL